ncbi:hypothetical protein KCP77_15155 [Salmonella enterica subsp. enterica]|nr:hypothetical protein KCP77_15155 [Salmonella enterica subsp. enterica]
MTWFGWRFTATFLVLLAACFYSTVFLCCFWCWVVWVFGRRCGFRRRCSLNRECCGKAATTD